MYWAQARIVEELVAIGDGEPVVFADASELAAHLRACDAVIVCGPGTVTIEEPALDDPDPPGTPADEVPTIGQLVLPIPIFLVNPRRLRTQNFAYPTLRPKPVNTKNPHRDPLKCE